MTRYLHINYEELINDGVCPVCGWKGRAEYAGHHTVTYECSCCNFSTKFINPYDSFDEWELDDYEEGDDRAFMDAVEKAEKEDLESSAVEHHIPTNAEEAGAKVIVYFNNLNSDSEDFIDECIIGDNKKPWQWGKSKAVRYLVAKIFELYKED